MIALFAEAFIDNAALTKDSLFSRAKTQEGLLKQG